MGKKYRVACRERRTKKTGPRNKQGTGQRGASALLASRTGKVPKRVCAQCFENSGSSSRAQAQAHAQGLAGAVPRACAPGPHARPDSRHARTCTASLYDRITLLLLPFPRVPKGAFFPQLQTFRQGSSQTSKLPTLPVDCSTVYPWNGLGYSIHHLLPTLDSASTSW